MFHQQDCWFLLRMVKLNAILECHLLCLVCCLKVWSFLQIMYPPVTSDGAKSISRNQFGLYKYIAVASYEFCCLNISNYGVGIIKQSCNLYIWVITFPGLFTIHLLHSLLYAVVKGLKKPTSNGCNRWLEWCGTDKRCDFLCNNLYLASHDGNCGYQNSKRLCFRLWACRDSWYAPTTDQTILCL